MRCDALKIALVDDNEKERSRLIEMLRSYGEKACGKAEIAEFASAEEFADAFSPGSFDVVFMDIYMEGRDGMQAARQIYESDRACRIVFTTSSREHAVESYDVGAAYYLVKPVEEEKLKKAIDTVCGARAPERSSIKIRTGGVSACVNLSDILFADVAEGRTRLHLREMIVKLDDRASDIFPLLSGDERFLSCNRNITVNMDHIERVADDFFIMNNGEYAPIKQRGRAGIKKAFLSYTLRSLQQ